jgi:hypothetical protein
MSKKKDKLDWLDSANFVGDPIDFDLTKAYDYGAPSRDGSHLTEEDRERLKGFSKLWDEGLKK